MATATTIRLGRALDGARILWRWYLASDDRKPNEGYVREFSPTSQRVRISETAADHDFGEWKEAVDIRVVEVLEERSIQRHAREALEAAKLAAAKAAAKKKRRKKENCLPGDEWKNTDDDDDDKLELGDDRR